jgi:hypothetical protein
LIKKIQLEWNHHQINVDQSEGYQGDPAAPSKIYPIAEENHQEKNTHHDLHPYLGRKRISRIQSNGMPSGRVGRVWGDEPEGWKAPEKVIGMGLERVQRSWISPGKKVARV